MEEVEITHPESPELAFLYGIIFIDYDDNDSSQKETTRSHVCVFGGNEVNLF